MKQQTAVQWILNEIFKKDLSIVIDEKINPKMSKIITQAKEMEKEQIEKSFNEGWLQCNIYELPEKSRKHFKIANEYFDFTYTQSSE